MDMKEENDKLNAEVDELNAELKDKFRSRFIMVNESSATVTIYASADLNENNCKETQDEYEYEREYMFENSPHNTIKTLNELNKSKALCELFNHHTDREPLVR